ncbi:NYN domain-containing protein [Candidatus Saccharibacteria bacterium]|nr:NYN domain-containing protein [Candidatus Saccharibacteria bacterium]
MAVERGINVVDGSHLFHSISRVWSDYPELKGKKLKIDELAELTHNFWAPYTGPTIRTILYFKKGDDRIRKMLTIPSANSPNLKSHWIINECAQSVDAIPEEEINKLSPQYRDQAHRREKGLDMELACDVFQLVASNRVDSVVFLVNDRDYIPLFKALHRLGANTYLYALDKSQPIQKELADLADLYHTFESELNKIFGYTLPPVEAD